MSVEMAAYGMTGYRCDPRNTAVSVRKYLAMHMGTRESTYDGSMYEHGLCIVYNAVDVDELQCVAVLRGVRTGSEADRQNVFGTTYAPFRGSLCARIREYCAVHATLTATYLNSHAPPQRTRGRWCTRCLAVRISRAARRGILGAQADPIRCPHAGKGPVQETYYSWVPSTGAQGGEAHRCGEGLPVGL